MQVSEATRRGLALPCRRPCPGPGGPASSPGSARTRGTPRHAPSSGGGASVPSSRRGCYLCSRGSAPLAGPFTLLYLIPPLLWGALGPPRLTTASATGARVTPVARTTYPAPHPKPAARILAFPPLRCLSNPSLRPCPGRLSGSRLGCRLPSGPLAALTPSGSAAASCPRVSGLSSRKLRPSPGLAKPPAVPLAVPFALPTPQRTERLGGPCLQARPFRSSSACSPCPRVPVPSSPLLQLACPKAGPHFWALPL